MYELPDPKEGHTYYNGSKSLSWLADLTGIPVDLVNFLVCQITALFLASLFRSSLNPSKVSVAIRHTFVLCIGLICGYFCFGQQAIHIAGLPTICYIVIRTQSPRFVQRSVLIVAMGYLLSIHLHRQIYDYGSYALDITGPLMIITQKVTSLAFSIHDGFRQEQEELTKAQKYHAVKTLPTALEYFSYVLHFQGIMAGPLVFYNDYIQFIEGTNFLKSHAANNNLDIKESKNIVFEPSPTKVVIKKVLGSFICAFIFMKLVSIYPIKKLNDDEFINNTSSPYKLWYAMMATTVVRFKYYHAWLLADAIGNNSGLGFNGYDKDGNAKWDLISNIHVLSFEFATNMRDAINNWNIGTNIWLRSIVYERVPKEYGTILTFTLSAVWHGFYPGYYLTFATGAVFVTAGRSARRMFRHRFQSTQFTRMFYDILTCLTTRVVMGYTTFPFVLLEFFGSMRLYLKFLMCLHVIGFITIFILPKFIRGEKRSNTVSKESIQSKDEHNKNEETTQINDFNSDLRQRKNNSKIHLDEERLNITETVRVKHDECEMDNLSNILREKIEIETKNIEEFIDKTVTDTVTGIVEFKNDLMRLDKNTTYLNAAKDNTRKRSSSDDNTPKEFLKKEIDAINAAVQQASVLPAVLSNGHAK